MNKQEIIEEVAKLMPDLTKTAVEQVVNHFFDVTKHQILTNNEVKIVGFGTFKKMRAKRRGGRNPQTGKKIDIPAQWRPKVSWHRTFREALNEQR